ncbi:MULTISPECIES: hypothetical protein [Aeromicrobium]|uniref:hypothetical protein n=1 Tax=Aeromicrobium TaxID=2040 RepID=UPI002580E8E3|nr:MULTISPECIES: hypothetical protein [Aeromicrobium]
MNEEKRFEWQAFRRARWGPVRVVVRDGLIEATVENAVVELDVTDRRPAAEREANQWRSVFDDGVPVSLNGARVATVTTAQGSPGGLVRRKRHTITGDAGFVLPGMEYTGRSLPDLVTLRCDAGVLVASRRWASPINVAVTEWSIVREYDLIAPRVTKLAAPEHIALWAALKESQRS